MATGKSDPLCEFDKLFTNNVPDILEKIFFALDYDSFIACGKVCTAWRELFSSQSYNLKAEELRVEMVRSGLTHYTSSKMYGTMHAKREERKKDVPKGMVYGPNGQLWPAWVFCTRYYNAEVHEVQYSDEED